MKLFKITALAAFVAGQFFINQANATQNAYYEEDSQFNQIAESSEFGYGWRQTTEKAYAYDTGHDSGGGWDSITVTADPWDSFTWNTETTEDYDTMS